jgi:ABC-type branched-subunit amino acid transport system substrate-binding protein
MKDLQMKMHANYSKIFTLLITAIIMAACVSSGKSMRDYRTTSDWSNASAPMDSADNTPRSLNTAAPAQNMQVASGTYATPYGTRQQPTAGDQAPVKNDYNRPYTAQIQSEKLLNAPQQYSYSNNGHVQQAAPHYSSYSQNAPQTIQHASGSVAGNIKIGLLLPLSGKHADLGQSMLKAAQLALFDMNYTNIELIPRDTGGTTSGARKAAQEAMQDGALLLLGPVFSHAVKGAKPIAAQYGVPLLGFSTDWRVAGNGTFVMGVLPFAQAQRMAEFAAQNNWRKIGIIASNSAYGNAVVNAFKNKALSLGLNIVQETRFTEGSTNISTEVREFARYDASQSDKNGKPKDDMEEPAPYDAIFVPVGGDQAKSLINLLAYYNLGTDRVTYLGTGLWDDSSFYSEPAAQKAFYAAPSPEARANFENKFMNVYGTQPPRLVSIAYDATALAAVLADQGLSRTGRPDYTPQALLNPNGFAGIDGIFRFLPNGRIERALAVHQIGRMSTKVVIPAATTFQTSSY